MTTADYATVRDWNTHENHEGATHMLNRIKGSKPQRKLTLVKLLTIVAVTNLIVWCLFTDTVYAVFTTAADLEGDNFKTHVIMSMFLGGVTVAAIYLLNMLFFGDILDSRSAWAFLLSGITVVTTAHLHGLVIDSIAPGAFFIVAGICIICSGGSGANVVTEQVDDSRGRS